VERSCAHARRFADLLGAEPELEVLNEVVLDQVLVRVRGDDGDERTKQAIARVQEDGVAWLSGTRWRGNEAIRISIVNWRTDEADVDATAASIVDAVRATA
jgi:glutamate/tyrosine decarboxylase-like PLP-dependent enzyme